MGLRETAEYLKISKETMYRLVTAGQIPVNRIGKLFRFNKTQIDNWVSSNPKVGT
jgi:excisionase family DNA binding protein